MENENKRDRRVEKTKKSIKSAFLALSAHKKTNEITITDVCKTCDINRKTFYAYYKGMYDVIDDIANDLIEKFMYNLQKQEIINIIENPYHMFLFLSHSITDDLQFHSLFLNSSIIDIVFEKIKNEFRNTVIESLKDKTKVGNEIHEYTFEYIASGIINTYKKWFCSEKKVSLQELSQHIANIVSKGIKSIILE